MVSEVELYLIRADDELLLANKDMFLSKDADLKSQLGIPIGKTFFYSVISHAYYGIFYAAKAYLFSKGIKTSPSGEHQKTFDEFVKLAGNGLLDKDLLEIYSDELMKAGVLLHIFKREKKKRGKFTYNIKSEANVPYAQESLDHSKKFITALKSALKR